MAIVNVLMAILSSFGFCAGIGLEYGPMHTLIGCLLVGLGVDNAFVIVQEFENSQAENKEKGLKIALEKRIAKGLSQAGVAVSVAILKFKILSQITLSATPFNGPRYKVALSVNSVPIAYTWPLYSGKCYFND